MKIINSTVFIAASLVGAIAIASSTTKTTTPKAEKEAHGEEGHDHEHGEGAGEKHESEAEHGHGEEEASPAVGPDKGILAADEHQGFKLAPEAEKTFEMKTTTVSAGGTVQLPKAAVVTAGTETNLFRLRDGFYKRIDFETVSRSQNTVSVRSKDLRPGDQIVIAGLGFLRIAEIAAFGGAPEGHSH
ncbi:MAG: hypothetical protein JNJ49_00580 [Bdellovibrionaceae bacterium]|nr:hypothetical protein [Pseudobdellovibrionaceae bacterium]